MINSATIFSTLGNANSLIPLAIKDFSATGGMTAGSFVTGKEEGVDRFIDEIGTEAIWLFGIPTYKWILDKTLFKAINLDSKFDARNLKDKDVFAKIKQYAPDEKVKKNIEKIGAKEKLFKNAVMGKFVLSTALTVGTYTLLTKFKQKFTEKKIRQNLIDEYNAKQKEEEKKKQAVNASSNPSFKGLGSVVESFAFSPVKNMWILDGCIAGERLKDSRSSQEFIGYAIKESFTFMLMYIVGAKIQNAIEKKAKEKHNKTIGFDARVIENGFLKKTFDDKSVEKSLAEFKAANTSSANLYEFLYKNPDNAIVKAAKQSDIIKLYKKTDKIDTRKFIDLEEIKGLGLKMEELYKQYKESLAKGETSEKFFSGVKKLKRNAIISNLGTCMLALGIITPGVMLLKRLTSGDDQEFKTKKIIREQLIKEGVIK